MSEYLKKIMSNVKFSIAYKYINPILFDVSLRDGIQNAKQENYPTALKQQIFCHIINKHRPNSIEVGSLINPKVLPILSDSLKLYKFSQQYLRDVRQWNESARDLENSYPEKLGVYMLIPSISKLKIAIENNIKHLSFITAVSNEFQKKNTNQTLEETKENMHKMFSLLENPEEYRIKLYISCINKCPISGIIETELIIREIFYYHEHFRFQELCLSDTCGELPIEEFRKIIDSCLLFGIPSSQIGLHLHYLPEKKENLKQIVHYALDKEIKKFDVSFLEHGGCSVTMKSKNLPINMTYDLFYEFLYEYIRKLDEKN
jgi:isopropylmalate/homocitrate/citramalate synthase